MRYQLRLNTDTQIFIVTDTATSKTASGRTIQAALAKMKK
ncbi:hypothetical protein LAM01_13050 [Amylolactobacillus amylophilus]|nr:hypothetical protein LAM01_13050 [Amylolactobacillus amylophilus]